MNYLSLAFGLQCLLLGTIIVAETNAQWNKVPCTKYNHVACNDNFYFLAHRTRKQSDSNKRTCSSSNYSGQTNFIHLPATVFPPVVRNLVTGSILKCMADLTGGLPLEVWKSSVMIESRQCHQSTCDNNQKPSVPLSSIRILQNIIQQQGVSTLWSGLSPRMIEGLFSGGVLLASKELLHTLLSDFVSPLLSKKIGMSIPSSIIGFISGAGGGVAQASIMGPTSLVVTACVAASKMDGRQPVSAIRVVRQIYQQTGIAGFYSGAPAVAIRQATNWASRQGFTEYVRPRLPIEGVRGELLAGCIGGLLSAWNTPFEVARVECQSRTVIMGEKTDTDTKGGMPLLRTMKDIVNERGVGALYVGIIPRAVQACYQTLFLVCVPRLLK